jgi:hypothetical protein
MIREGGGHCVNGIPQAGIDDVTRRYTTFPQEEGVVARAWRRRNARHHGPPPRSQLP